MSQNEKNKTKVQKISEFHFRRLKGLQKAIDEGTYNPNFSKVAESILTQEKDLIPTPKDKDLTSSKELFLGGKEPEPSNLEKKSSLSKKGKKIPLKFEKDRSPTL